MEERTEMEIQELIDFIEEKMPGDYKLLECCDDTLYIKNRISGNHYAIKITECVE